MKCFFLAITIVFSAFGNGSTDSVMLAKRTQLIIEATDSLKFLPEKWKKINNNFELSDFNRKGDSLIISFYSFNIDSIQCINIPLYSITEIDTVKVLDTTICLPFKSSLSIYDREPIFIKNYKQLPKQKIKKSSKFIYIASAVFLLLLMIIILYKPAAKYYKIYKLKNYLHKKIRLIDSISPSENPRIYIGKINDIVKEVLTKVLNKNYKALTLDEFKENIPKELSFITTNMEYEYAVFYYNKPDGKTLSLIKENAIKLIDTLKDNYKNYVVF